EPPVTRTLRSKGRVRRQPTAVSTAPVDALHNSHASGEKKAPPCNDLRFRARMAPPLTQSRGRAGERRYERTVNLLLTRVEARVRARTGSEGVPAMFGPVPQQIDGLTGGWRRNALLVLAALVFAVAALIAFRAIAAGGGGEILRVRFGGDAERTRVVIDLEASTRGQIVDAAPGSTRFTLALTGIGPGDSPRGAGLGLVRQYEVDSVAGASRLRLTLTRPAEVERRFLLPPGDGVAHYRYVIDLKAPDGAPAAQTAAAAPPPPPPEPRLSDIDPGHGGRDPGALGANARESEMTLAAARTLKGELERKGYRVLLTRDADVYIPHDRRVSIAREADADLFISLHADAGSAPETRGASVYTLSEQGAERAVR